MQNILLSHPVRIRRQPASRQQGAILVISLLLLMVLTIIGVAGIQGTVLEERMASNMREQNYALQAAEAATRHAEALVEGLYSRSIFNNSDAMYTRNNPALPDPLLASDWEPAANKTKEVTELGDLTINLKGYNPRYFIEEIGEVEEVGKNLGLTGYDKPAATGEIFAFRVVARGVGPNGSGQVLVQSHYGKLF